MVMLKIGNPGQSWYWDSSSRGKSRFQKDSLFGVFGNWQWLGGLVR